MAQGGDGDRLDDLFDELRRIVDRRRTPPPPPAAVPGDAPPPQSPGTLGDTARWLLNRHADIGRYLDPRLFSDPAFDILLDLYVADEEGRTVFAKQCRYAARVPDTTSLRWIGLLENEGLVARRPDLADRRRVVVCLTRRARLALDAYLARVQASGRREGSA